MANLKLRHRWGLLYRGEKGLIAGAAVYAILVPVYFFAWHGTTLKYLVALLGFALLPFVSLVRNYREYYLIALVIGIAVGNTGMQIRDDESKHRAAAELKAELHQLRLEKWRDLDVKEAERRIRAQEKVLEHHPLDAIRNLQHSPAGFERKADRIALRAALEESRLLAARPHLAKQILGFPAQPSGRLAAYAALPGPAPGAGAVVAALRHEVAYREAARFVREKIVPDYQSVEKAIGENRMDAKQVLEALSAIERRLAERLATLPLAGLFNHAGLLAMAQGAGSRALGMHYAALAADAEHIPAYESVAYASWSVNQETGTAIKYARRGMDLAAAYPASLAAEYAELDRNYAAAERAVPAVSGALKARKERFSSLAGELRRSFGRGSVSMMARLQLLYAYCSGLELQNEKEARAYARALYDSDPEDAEYQDALGLVLLVFAKTPAELDEADRLFALAGKGRSEQMTKDLLVLHRAKVDEKRRLLGFSR